MTDNTVVKCAVVRAARGIAVELQEVGGIRKWEVAGGVGCDTAMPGKHVYVHLATNKILTLRYKQVGLNAIKSRTNKI